MDEPTYTRRVGKASKIPNTDFFKAQPQSYLKRTHHPYAPFPGDPLEWDSYVFHDGTMYEGLTRCHTPHGKGVMIMGQVGNGAGFNDTKPGDKYEGEFHTGHAHGVGMYSSVDSIIYKGEFTAGFKSGCGAQYDLGPWKDLIKEGVEPQLAWEQSKQLIHDGGVLGTWHAGNYISAPTDSGRFCSLGDIRRVLRATDNQVNKARMFEYQPDGQANMMKNLLPDGAPAPIMQHPIHYPHGTLFMAPGPAGQTESIPDSPVLRELMLKAYRNYRRIHDSYNFDYVPASDSIMAKALRWHRKQAKLRAKEERVEKMRADTYLNKVRKEDEKRQAAAAKKKKGSKKRKTKDVVDDDDLVADATRVMNEMLPQAGAQQHSGIGPSAFGSITLSMSRAQMNLHRYVDNILKRAPPMPRLGGPK